MADRIDHMVRRFRDILAETERLDPQALRLYQESLLVPLLEHARRNVPYYKKRLAPLFRGGAIELSRWPEVPILTRAEAQQKKRALTAARIPAQLGSVRSNQTSGSTGRPLDFEINELVDVAAVGMTDRTYRWWQFDGDRAMASIYPPRSIAAPAPDGVTLQGWRTGFPNGLHHIINLPPEEDVLIDWLIARRPAYLSSGSWTLGPMARRVQAHGLTLRFDGIVAKTTMVSDETRALCLEVFGTRLADQYGADEIGHIAGECPSCGEYHVSAEAVLVEIVDDAGAPCAAGETGRVILTSLYNYAMPFIRYEIGDLATVGTAPRPCHIKLPTLARIAGRYRNTYARPDGRVVYPAVQFGRLRDHLSFTQAQLVQTDYGQLELRYVPGDAARDADLAGIEAYLRTAVDADLQVRVVAVDAIPRHPSGKFEEFISLVSRQRP
jgi:phenylacetate-CoA ligase